MYALMLSVLLSQSPKCIFYENKAEFTVPISDNEEEEVTIKYESILEKAFTSSLFHPTHSVKSWDVPDFKDHRPIAKLQEPMKIVVGYLGKSVKVSIPCDRFRDDFEFTVWPSKKKWLLERTIKTVERETGDK